MREPESLVQSGDQRPPVPLRPSSLDDTAHVRQCPLCGSPPVGLAPGVGQPHIRLPDLRADQVVEMVRPGSAGVVLDERAADKLQSRRFGGEARGDRGQLHVECVEQAGRAQCRAFLLAEVPEDPGHDTREPVVEILGARWLACGGHAQKPHD